MNVKISVYVFSVFILLFKSVFVCASVGVSMHQRERVRLSKPSQVTRATSPPNHHLPKLLTTGL